MSNRAAMNSRRGFTLIEVVIILGVIAILAAMAIPMVLRIFERTAEDATREEMDNLKRAMIGDPRKLQSSFRSDFGFLGDIGCVPTSLARLSSAGSLPTPFTFDSTKQTGAGWNGPYISGTPGEEFDKDQLGNLYNYTVPAGACPLTVTTLTSNGPDGQPSTADDITLSIAANETTGTARGSVKNNSGVGLGNVSVELYHADQGVLVTKTATTDVNGNYSIGGVPFGHRAVKPNPTLVLVPGSVTVTGGPNDQVNFQVTNHSGTSITVTNINVICPAGVTDYDGVTFDGNSVDPGGEELCGTTYALSGGGGTRDLSANPTPPSSVRVVVDSADTQLPDLTLRGGGTTRTIQLQDFENGAPPVDMRNKTLTVTLTLSVGGPTVITFTTPP
jgi:prepilin-type N-terminal cleavage/methylation domain-containing protein